MRRGIFEAIRTLDPGAAYFVIVDALGQGDRQRLRKILSAQRIRTLNVRGPRDETEPFLRLADALAGFLGDYHKGKSYALRIWGELCQLFKSV